MKTAVTPLRSGVGAGAATAWGSMSTPTTREGAEAGRCDGQDARAASMIEEGGAGAKPLSSHSRLQPCGGVGAGAEGHSEVEDQADGVRVRASCQDGYDPQAMGNAYGVELGLRQLDPVLPFGDLFHRVVQAGRRRPAQLCGSQNAATGVRFEQGGNPRMLPEGAAGDPGSPNWGFRRAYRHRWRPRFPRQGAPSGERAMPIP